MDKVTAKIAKLLCHECVS